MIYKFSTPSCYMCKNLSKALAQHDIKYTEVDCTDTDNKKLVEKYCITGVPAILCIKGNSSVIYRNYGDILKNIDIIKNYAE